MPVYFHVSLSDNPGPLVEENGPEKGVIVVKVETHQDTPPPDMFSMACTQFDLGNPRISRPLPWLQPVDDAWRSIELGRYTFFTDCPIGSFAQE